ncbi:hypothetical protein EMPG_15444 [Blastomyces silverae]|uniref:Uncharacterized protein n=1 Tax=Blastomyces silverae TaxID=2060906 RepID=A0A0H1BIY9_9EURO|nr:hypothetical protein EMPG_15444 [Blastomyces silverae]
MAKQSSRTMKSALIGIAAPVKADRGEANVKAEDYRKERQAGSTRIAQPYAAYGSKPATGVHSRMKDETEPIHTRPE